MSWIHLKDAVHTAKKKHKCVGCMTFIQVGTKYIYRVGIQAGDFTVDKWHIECEAFAFQEYPKEIDPITDFTRKEALEWYANAGKTS